MLALAVAIGAAIVLLIAAPWQSTGRDDIARAAAMITLKPGTVLHVRADGHDIYSPFSEQWLAPDGSWRDEHGGSNQSGACTVENGYEARTHTLSTYVAGRNTIYRQVLSSALSRIVGAWPDQIAQVRGWLSSDQLHVAGTALIDGRHVRRLVPTHGTTLRGVQAYYVDARTSAPVRWQINAKQWYDYTVYERLPATKANLALASLSAHHPTARQRLGSGAGVRGGCGSG